MDNQKIIDALLVAYWAELETIQNYIANSVNLQGVRAVPIKEALRADISAELAHATLIAERVAVIGGRVPGSLNFHPKQTALQPPREDTDVVSVIKGVIEAENKAITQYRHLISLCEGIDYVTQDLCIKLLGEEELHLREFKGFLKEYETQ